MKRAIYSQLLQWKSKTKRKPLILEGARQVGKTYILRQFGHNEFRKYHYFDFERERSLHGIFDGDIEPQRIVDSLELAAKTTIDCKSDLIFFDEVQACPRALTSLKYFEQEMQELAICAAGSLLGVALSPDPFPVGKVETITLLPMSFAEFLLALGEVTLADALSSISFNSLPDQYLHERLFEQFLEYLIVGGMPEVVLTYREETSRKLTRYRKVRNVQTELISNHLRDISKHCGKVNGLHIERVFENIPEQLARESASTGTNKYVFKGVLPNDSRYSRLAGPIDWLIKAGLVHRASIISDASSVAIADKKENRFKLYLFDVGLLLALSNISPEIMADYNVGPFKGWITENFVAQELVAHGQRELISWTGRTSEIEFLISQEKRLIPVEVKSGRNRGAKSLGVFINYYRPPYAYILTGDLPTLKKALKTSKTVVRKYPVYAAANIVTGREGLGLQI